MEEKEDLSPAVVNRPVCLVCKKVWTFVIHGGEPFDLRLPNNPNLHHEGGVTIWKLVGTRRLAYTAQEMMEELGATVQRYTEGESEEQKAEREGRLPSR